MLKKPVRFRIKAKRPTTIKEVLEIIEEIKKVHPNAKVDVEVEV